MKKYLLVILVVAWYINPIAYACSVVSSHITNEKGEIIQVMTGRTQDYELGILHTTPVKGAKGTQNTSHVNIGEIPKKQAVTWQNKYKYIGIPIGSPVYNNRLNEGINTQGLYAAQLALPQVTSYPNPKIGNNQPKILGVLDFVNYVLGTSKNVKQAINNLKKVQVVASGLYDSSNDRYHVLPVHWFLKDKTGHGAVIEFINGEMKIYSGKHAGQRINALTNAPSYDWQVKHYKSQKSKFKQNNTSYQVDGIYANGSGYKGLAGDYMPQSRFVRIKTILNALPSPYTEGQLNNNVQMILNSVTVPIGMNPAPTVWKSKTNLTKGIYTIIPVLKLAMEKKFIPVTNRREYSYNVHDPILTHTVKIKYPQNITDDSSKIIIPKGPSPGTSYDASYVNEPIQRKNDIPHQTPLP